MPHIRPSVFTEPSFQSLTYQSSTSSINLNIHQAMQLPVLLVYTLFLSCFTSTTLASPIHSLATAITTLTTEPTISPLQLQPYTYSPSNKSSSQPVQTSSPTSTTQADDNSSSSFWTFDQATLITLITAIINLCLKIEQVYLSWCQLRTLRTRLASPEGRRGSSRHRKADGRRRRSGENRERGLSARTQADQVDRT